MIREVAPRQPLGLTSWSCALCNVEGEAASYEAASRALQRHLALRHVDDLAHE